MRVILEPIYLTEVALDRMTQIDQLTIVRNHARRGIAAHDRDAEGGKVREVEVEVVWLDGTVETLVFDRMCGFPIEPKRDWFTEWRRETLRLEGP